MKISARIALVTSAFVVTACSSGGDSGAAADGTVATAGPSAWRITPDGFGPLKAGQSVADAATAVGSSFALAEGESQECGYAAWAAAPSGVRVMIVQDTVVRVDVTQGAVSTVEGARIGDTEGRINSLFQGRVMIGPHKYTTGKYMTVMPAAGADTAYRIIFETDGEKVTQFRSGLMPEVEYVEGCS